MKNILGWVKANLLVVVFSALIVISLPVAFFFASGWRESIRADRSKAANDEMKKVSGALVTYNIPSFDPSQKPVELKTAPNAELTRWFKEQRDNLGQAAGSVVKRAEEFNRGVGDDAKRVGRSEHKPMVDGLFPSGADIEAERLKKEMGEEKWNALTPEERTRQAEAGAKEIETAKLNEMEETLLAKRGKPNLYEELLKSVHAGAPGDPVRIASDIKEMAVRETNKITAGKRALTNDENGELVKRLAERRLAAYQDAARNISVYATLDVWPKGAVKGGCGIPFGKIEPANINLDYFYVLQWDYWVYQDLIAAVKLANGGNSGGVADSVVKRIESINLKEPEGLFASEDAFGRSTEVTHAAPPAAAIPGMVPVDPEVSITGRGTGEWNTVYDIRRVEMTVIVSSARINEFLDAITRTNFMSVTDLDLSEVNVFEDLRNGYYYGQEHVVRARVGIETVWLRSWMTKYMSPGVASGLGAGKKADAPAAAPPPPPSGRGVPPGGGRGMPPRKGGG